MKKIYLIRHAQSVANALDGKDLIQYPNDKIPITELGKQQAETLADWLIDYLQLQNGNPDLQGIFTSPYLRTQQTAQPFLTKIQQTAEILHDLHEFNYLAFAKIHQKNREELAQLAENYWQKNDPNFKDGEECDSFAEFYHRIERTKAYFAQKEAGTYVVFGHGFWIGLFIWQLFARHPQSMQDFRTFELFIRPRNTEVYLWQITQDANLQAVHSIGKVRTLSS